ncbi:glycosyltransferase [Patescibacteria group bacterium]
MTNSRIKNILLYIEAYKRKLFYRISRKITLKPQDKPCGRVLLSYIFEPFLLKPNQKLSTLHTSYWECKEIANIFLKHGYIVDVIRWNDEKFIPTKKYDFMIDIKNNLERLTPHLNKDCLKIMHIVSSHPKFQNEAEQKRLDNLEKRRGVKLIPKRTDASNENIKYADFISGLGNKTTFKTYSDIKKQIYPIPISTTVIFPKPNKNIHEIKKNFLWLGGGGTILKGLDLVIEVFADMPEYNLFVCGPVCSEKEFFKFYEKEFSSPNIKLFGRIDVAGEQFKKIAQESLALIYPSASEGQSGAVITAMHAGIIPIISKNSGVNIENFGSILEKCSEAEIKENIIKISSLPNKELKRQVQETWTYANKYHTRKRFSEEYNKFIDILIKNRNEK